MLIESLSKSFGSWALSYFHMSHDVKLTMIKFQSFLNYRSRW